MTEKSANWQYGKITESGYYWIPFYNDFIIIEIDVEEQAISFMGDETSSIDLSNYNIEKWIKIEKPKNG